MIPTWALWALGLGLLVVRGLLSAADTALYGISDARARELRDVHPRRGARLVRLKTEREATAAAIRFGMVLSGFTAACIATLVPPRLLGAPFEAIDGGWRAFLVPLASALLLALLASLIDVVFRAGAAASSEAWALGLSSFVSATSTLLYPVMRLMMAPLNLVLRPFGARVSFEAPPPPLEELEKLLQARAVKHEVDKGAPQLIRGVFGLTNKTCRDLMVPRTQVVAVDISTPPGDILLMISEENHSRIPVFANDIDHIVGVLHVRDLVPLMQNPELIVLHDLVRPAVYVPWVKPIGDLLRDMQRQRIHMAMVVDEYGGFMGIVTLEDILREIVGDIGDEFEEVSKPFEKQADGSFLVDAGLAPGDFVRTFDFQLPEGEYETLGGFLASLAGALPEVGERFTVNGWVFVVHSKKGPRLDRIRVVKPRPSPEKREKEAGAELLPPRASPVRP